MLGALMENRRAPDGLREPCPRGWAAARGPLHQHHRTRFPYSQNIDLPRQMDPYIWLAVCQNSETSAPILVWYRVIRHESRRPRTVLVSPA